LRPLAPKASASANSAIPASIRKFNMPAMSEGRIATHVQGIGNAMAVQTMLRHTKPDTAQINYVQPVADSVRSTVDKLTSVLLG